MWHGEFDDGFGDRPELPDQVVRPVLDVADWLARAGLSGVSGGPLLAGFCERVLRLGVPLARSYVATSALHPLYSAFGYTWVPGRNAVPEETHSRADEVTASWQDSPFRRMLEGNLLRLRYGPDALAGAPFPMLRGFAADGATEYFAALVGFSGRARGRTDGVITSWLTRASGGFADWQLAVLEWLLPHFAAATAQGANYRLSETLLETYVGRTPGRRVLAGEIERGHFSTLRAVIYFADLRGFSALSERLPGAEMVALLNDYLGLMAGPVLARGGDVLKFMGDGVLGVFDVGDDEGIGSCHVALGAARDAWLAVEAFNAERRAGGGPVLELDLVLHLGDVLYGNVGAPGRLDFTVIGQAVNEASRMEAMARDLGTHLVISESFQRAAAHCREHLVSLGRHRLRDLAREAELFTLPERLLREGVA